MLKRTNIEERYQEALLQAKAGVIDGEILGALLHLIDIRDMEHMMRNDQTKGSLEHRFRSYIYGPSTERYITAEDISDDV